MFQLVKNLGWKKFVFSESIPFAFSLFISESFYKFGSFILECFAFLGTWYLLSWLTNAIFAYRRRPMK